MRICSIQYTQYTIQYSKLLPLNRQKRNGDRSKREKLSAHLSESPKLTKKRCQGRVRDAIAVGTVVADRPPHRSVREEGEKGVRGVSEGERKGDAADAAQ